MDYLKQLITYFKTNHLWVKLKYGNNKDFDPKEISDPIVKSIKDKIIPLVNPDDISNPIVSAQKETTQAIKEITIPEVKIPKVDFSELSKKITDLKEVLLNKEMVVNQGDVKVNLDLKPAIKAIEKLEQSMPKFEKQEVIDYTLMFDEMMKIMETPRYSQYLETMTGLLKIISERKDKELPEYFKLDKHQLAQLIPISMIHAKHLNLAGAQVNPATEEKQDDIVTAIGNISIQPATGGATEEKQDDQVDLSIRNQDEVQEWIESLKKEESGEINTIDENLRRVLGTENIVNKGKLNVNAVPEYSVFRKNLALVTNSIVLFDVTGYNSLAIQVSGTWTGTLTFECSLDGGNFIAMNGVAVNGTTNISTTTANGLFRFNVAGIIKVSVRFSTTTTGSPIILFVASPEPSSIISNTVTIAGAVTTTDSILPGTITTQALPANVIPVAPSTPASGINNFLSTRFPQIFQRLRVESAGDKRVPFAQEENTFRQKTVDDEVRLLLQNILRQLEISNNFKFQELDRNGHPNLRIPEGFNEF